MLSRTSLLFFSAVLAAAAVGCIADTDCPNVITRSSWGAKEAKQVAHMNAPVPNVIIHHTATAACLSVATCVTNVHGIQSYHMNNLGWDDIAYSFLIGGDGNVYEGRGWNITGAHTAGWNAKSVGIAFMGNYQDTEPSRNMLAAARKLILCGKSQMMLGNDVKVLGARQVRPTASPGDKLFDHVKNWPEWSAIP